jgi:hypothetical protein
MGWEVLELGGFNGKTVGKYGKIRKSILNDYK